MFGENLTFIQASIIALFSITIVFLVLLAISYLIRLIAWIVNRAQKPKEEPAAKSTPAVVEETAETEDDSHLTAVITAAVAAYLGTDAGSFIVKSITPLNTESEWSRVSRTKALQ